LIAHFNIFCQQQVNWIYNKVTCDRGARKSYTSVIDSTYKCILSMQFACSYRVMPCFSSTSIVLYRVFDSKCNTILNNQWREQVQCQTLFVFLFCFTFHLNLNQLYKCPRVIMNNNMPICYFILHLFYMSRQIALTGYICMYCQWPKYSFLSNTRYKTILVEEKHGITM
jgi:hypothetical protein